MSSTAKRVVQIDIARAFAALAVVLIHICDPALDASYHEHKIPLFYLSVLIVSRFAVPMFVVLSGMGLALSYRPNETYLQFIRRRLSKLLPAYIAWTVVYSFAYHGGLVWKTPSFPTLGYNILTGNACSHLYFVPRIIELYLLFPFIYKVLRTKIGWIASITVAVGLILARHQVHSLGQLGLISQIGSSLSWLVYFVTGIWLVQSEHHLLFRKPSYRLAASILLPVAMVGMIVHLRGITQSTFSVNTVTEYMKVYNIFYVPLLIAWILGIQWTSPLVLKPLKQLAVQSYGLYLSHFLVLLAYRAVYSALGLPSPSILLFTSSLVVAMVFCVILPESVRSLRTAKKVPAT